jgi:hypothetical protein
VVVLSELGSNDSDSGRHGVQPGKNLSALPSMPPSTSPASCAAGQLCRQHPLEYPIVATREVMSSGLHAIHSMWYNHKTHFSQEESQIGLRTAAGGFGGRQKYSINGALGRNTAGTHHQKRAPGPPRATRDHVQLRLHLRRGRPPISTAICFTGHPFLGGRGAVGAWPDAHPGQKPRHHALQLALVYVFC